MPFITLLSSLAIVIGLLAAVPQLLAMVRSRSAAGQSSLGWCLAAFVNAIMAYVNFAGYHAMPLAAGNVGSVVIAGAALALVARFGTAPTAPAAPPRPAHPAAVPLSDLATQELVALRVDVEHEARRRGDRLVAAA